MHRPIFCEACKQRIAARRELHVDEEGRFEHRSCASGRAAARYRRWDDERKGN